VNEYDRMMRVVFGGERAPSLTKEQLTIAADALRRGCPDGTRATVVAYTPLLRKMVGTFAAGAQGDRLDEARQVAVGAVVSATMQRCNVKAEMYRAFQEWMGSLGAMYIPSRTQGRYTAIVKAAGERGVQPVEVLSEFGMSLDVFVAVQAANGSTGILEELIAVPSALGELLAVEDAVLAARALEGMSPDSRETCRWAYGFEDGEPHTDLEVAIKLSMSPSVVQRRRAAGLRSAREALGLIGEGVADVYDLRGG